MPHIHTTPGQHDHTVSAFIIRIDGEEPRLVLHRHRKLGVYMQFGGHIELDETPWQAIAHELQEESGYSLDQLDLLQPQERLLHLTHAVVHPTPFNYNTHPITNQEGHFHTDTNFAFVTEQAPVNKPEASESEDIQLFSATELQQLSKEDINENVRELGLFVLSKLLEKWERIPASAI